MRRSAMAAGIWVRLMEKSHIIKDTIESCTHENWTDALNEACRRLDLSCPVLMPKHYRDFETFSQTRFLPDHFIDSFPYDRMEVEYIDPDSHKSVNEKYL